MPDPESNSRERYGVELLSYREYFDLALPAADRARTDFEEFFKGERYEPWERDSDMLQCIPKEPEDDC